MSRHFFCYSFLAALPLLAGCSSAPPPAPPPVGLAFHPNVPAEFRAFLTAQYLAFPAHLQRPVTVRVGTQDELRRIANPNSHQWIGGVYDQPGNTIWLADTPRDARWTFAHEYGHVVWAPLGKARWDEWRAWWNAGGGKPVARFWQDQPDASGNRGNYAEGWGDAFAWVYGPIGGPVFTTPAPPTLAAKVRELTGDLK